MTARTVSVVAGILAAIATIDFGGMVSARPAGAASTDHLVTRLSPGDPDSRPHIRVSIANEHPTQPLTLLTWDTPLDPSALSSGVIFLADAETGERIPGPDLKLSRKLPPPREALVTVAPGSSVQHGVPLQAPWIPGHGRTVVVGAEGRWRAVWATRKEDVRDEELAAMAGEGVMTGSLKSVEDVRLVL